MNNLVICRIILASILWIFAVVCLLYYFRISFNLWMLNVSKERRLSYTLDESLPLKSGVSSALVIILIVFGLIAMTSGSLLNAAITLVIGLVVASIIGFFAWVRITIRYKYSKDMFLTSGRLGSDYEDASSED